MKTEEQVIIRGPDVTVGTGIHTEEEEFEELDKHICHLLRGDPRNMRGAEQAMSFCGEYGQTGLFAIAFTTEPSLRSRSPRETPCPVCGRKRCEKCSSVFRDQL